MQWPKREPAPETNKKARLSPPPTNKQYICLIHTREVDNELKGTFLLSVPYAAVDKDVEHLAYNQFREMYNGERQFAHYGYELLIVPADKADSFDPDDWQYGKNGVLCLSRHELQDFYDAE